MAIPAEDVENTDTIDEGSNLAAIAVNDTVFVYFRNEKNKLKRVGGSNGKWSGAKDVSSWDVTPGSSIGLVPHKSEGETLIWHFFYHQEQIIADKMSSKP